MSKHRGHEQHEIEDIGDVARDFSDLPDCILDHILSLMPTKEAVKTSILSTRWKNLWDSVPNLDVDATEVDHWHPPTTSFKNFLERVLRLRGASNIKKFRLTCSGSSKESQMRSWISDAIRHNVQELDLGISGGVPSTIPWSVLDRTSLVSLKIKNICVSELAPCVSFPCLKFLRLDFAVFTNEGHAEKLLLGCPVLEELVLSDIDTWMDLKNIVISNSTLKRLTIRDMLRYGAYDDPTSGCKIKIDATNLTYFEYDGFLSNDITLNNVSSSLVEACIDIVRHPRWKKVALRAVNLLEQLQYVVSLRVSYPAIESLMFVDNMRARFPMFENLSHLTLTKEIRTKTFGVVMDFLYLCPNLQSICLSEGFEHHMRLVENDPNWLSLRACVSNCIKTVILKKFHGYQSEICFLKCILKYARVLERMNIWWSETKKLKDVKKTEVMTEIETIKTTCVVKFS